MKITIKDRHGDSKTYDHPHLKIWRDGSTVELYFNKSIDNGNDSRKIILAVASEPSLVSIEAEPVKETPKPLTESDKEENEKLLKQYELLAPKKEKKPRGRPRKQPVESSYISNGLTNADLSIEKPEGAPPPASPRQDKEGE